MVLHQPRISNRGPGLPVLDTSYEVSGTMGAFLHVSLLGMTEIDHKVLSMLEKPGIRSNLKSEICRRKPIRRGKWAAATNFK